MSVSLKVKIFDSKGTRILQVAKSTLTIGSASHCDVVLEDPSVQPEHTRAWLDGGRIWIQDMGSTSGTALNDIRLPALKPMLVRDLDVLRLGESQSTLGLEAILVRAPVVKPKVADPVAKESTVPEPKGLSNVELQKRREEAAQLARELAELRLQLQMGNLEKSSNEEMGQQLANLRGEIERVQEQKAKWDENLRQMEAEKLAMHKNIDKELLEFKAKALKDLKKAASEESIAKIQTLNHEIKKLQEQRQILTEGLAQAEAEKEALRVEIKKTASSETERNTVAVNAEIKKLVEQKNKLNESLKQAELEKESLRKSFEKDKTDNKGKSSKDVNAALLIEAQKFETWKNEAMSEMSRLMQKVSSQKSRHWAGQALTQDMIGEWENEINQNLRRVILNEQETVSVSQLKTGRLSESDSEREARRTKRRRQARANGRALRSLTMTSLILGIIVLSIWVGTAYYKSRTGRSLTSSSQVPERSAVEPDRKAEHTARKYDPKKSKKYRSSYTENVLYLENYVAAEENAEFRKQWMTELNRVASNDWKVDTWSISPIGVLEQNLVQDLEHIKTTINPDKEQEGIEKMHAREGKFLKDLDAVFKTHANVERFLKFKRSFYQRNQAYLSRSS
ncbi:MAG: FHA domain-containing protein [Bdellovibrionales bacterium]